MTNWILAAVALLLGLAAAVAGDPYAPGAAPPPPAARVSAVDVAEWIRDRRPGLRIVDLRPTIEFDDFHLPLAEQIDPEDLGASGLQPGETVVVYAGPGDGAVRAWRTLDGVGFQGAYYLEDGVTRWLTDVMSPTISPDATEEERELFDRAADVSRYFGGLPRVVDAEAEPAETTAAELLTRTRRRGCAF